MLILRFGTTSPTNPECYSKETWRKKPWTYELLERWCKVVLLWIWFRKSKMLKRRLPHQCCHNITATSLSGGDTLTLIQNYGQMLVLSDSCTHKHHSIKAVLIPHTHRQFLTRSPPHAVLCCIDRASRKWEVSHQSRRLLFLIPVCFLLFQEHAFLGFRFPTDKWDCRVQLKHFVLPD